MVFRDSSKVFTHHKSMGAIDPPYVPQFKCEQTDDGTLPY